MRLSPAIILVLCCVLLVVVTAVEKGFTPVWIATLTLVIAVSAVVVRAWSRPLNRTDSLLWGNAALAVMFGAHPIATVITGVIDLPFHDKFDLAPGYVHASALGLLATVAFNVGYFIRLYFTGADDPLNAATPFRPVDDSPRLARRMGWILVALGLLGYTVFAITTGQDLISSLLSGAQRGSGASSTAYLYLAPQLIAPASLLFLYADLVDGRRPIVAAVLAVVQIFLFLPTGQRLVLLLGVAPIFIAYLLIRRIRLRSFLVALLVVGGVLGIVTLRDLNAPEAPSPLASLVETFTNPVPRLLEMVTGDDTEMVDALAVEVQVVPRYLPHEPFSVLVNTASAPVPSALWSAKPAPMDVTLNYYLLNVGPNNPAIAYSFVGELYYDSGALGVFLGFLLLGLVSSLLTRMAVRTVRPDLLLVYAAFLPAIISLMRGSLIYTLGRGLFTIFPLIIFCWLVTRLRRKQGAALPRADQSSLT